MPLHGNRRRLAALASGGALIGLAFSAGLPTPSDAAAPAAGSAGHTAAKAGSGDGGARTPGYLDVRQVQPSSAALGQMRQLGSGSSAVGRYVRSLGPQAVVDIDPLTGTARQFGRLDGYLTGPSTKPARTVALDYVRSHAADLGLSAADLKTLVFSRDYVDPSGLHNLSWTQQADGTTVFGNGLKVKVTRDGRVLDVQGSPVHDLAGLAARAPKTTKIDAAQARGLAARNVGAQPARATVATSRSGSRAATTWTNHDYAKRVWFLTPHGLRPGWSTYVVSSAGGYQHVVDAVTGSVLLRRSTTDQDAAPTVAPAAAKGKPTGEASVYRYYPGAPKGGTPSTVNFYKMGWLTRGASFLNGTNVIAWADLNDDNAINAGEKTPVPGVKKKHSSKAQFALKPQHPSSSSLCSKHYVCTWKPNVPGSWKVNKKADVTNAFYLANRFHDWLQNGPAQFTIKAGNFTKNGGDPVLLNALDGANTANGLPDGNHIDNANMSTPPDGTPPTMQMYLWHQPGATDEQDGFVPTSGAFDPSVLFHEFTHGLSNRLVVDADGVSTLNDLQAGSMGEAWSDYYAMDYLVRQGLVKDTNKAGEVFEGTYLTAGKFPFRTMAIDCPVHSQAKGCSTALDGKAGGYTYADVPTIGNGPEVHSSGEVWAQTLWDIRKEFGSTKADQLITRAMPLSADDPSMLDMRNAIIQADLTSFGGKDTAKLWKIFADRGMGYFAGSIDSGDTQPANDFHTPPNPATKRVSITGTVTDSVSGDPVAGAVVLVSGFGTQFAALTDAQGHYTISNLYQGTYAKVVSGGAGYFTVAKKVAATGADGGTADFTITRDYASESGGASIADFTGPDYSPQCGPEGAIDLSLGTGWGSSTGDDNGDPTNVFVPKHITIQLPAPVDISTVQVDPTATCGDGGSASTGGYTIETSTDGTTFVPAASGTFTAADRGHLNDVTLNAGTGTGVQYVRFTMTSNQTPDFATNCPAGNYSGCSFTDLSEIAVLGTES